MATSLFGSPGSIPATPSSIISYTPEGAGAVVTTVEAKLRKYVDPIDKGAVGDGVTDDAAALNAALSSGAKVIDGHGLTYKINSQVTVPANVTFQNTVLQLADSNYLGLAYNSGSKLLEITVLGTSRTNQYPSAQRGIGAASAGRTNVTIRARVENCNINFDADGTSDSDLQLIVKNASGQTGLSEGYGALLYQGANRNKGVIWAIGNQRHGVYISSGSCDNKIVVFDSGTKDNFGVQINTDKSQPLCTGNVISGSSYGSAGGVVLAQQSTASADAGGGLQNNIVKDFEVVGLAAAVSPYVANLYPAYLISISQVGAQPASGNGFLNCSARGQFNSTTLGVMHVSGTSPKDVTIRDVNIRAVCLNAVSGAFVIDGVLGITRISGVNIDLLTSGAGIIGSYFNIAAGNYFTFDDVQIVCPSATKVFFSGATNLQKLGDGNTYNVPLTITAVPATGSKTGTINVPSHLQSSTVCTAIVTSQSVATNAQSQVIVSGNTGAVITLTVYNGHAAPQDITITAFISGLPG
jgi:hypothetical protein